MKRLLLTASALLAVVVVVFLLFFTVSKYRVEGQSYFHSLSDFVFMIRSYNAEAFGSSVRPLTDRNYEKVMGHARETAHGEVRRRVVRSLVSWDDDVVPRLLVEIDQWKSSGRVLVAARALGELRAEIAAPRLEVALELARSERGLVVRLIEAFAQIGPTAAPGLIASYRGYRERGEDPPYNFLDAIGQSGGGADFLLAEMSRARTAEEILALEWPLAFTRDLRSAKILAGLLRHPNLHVRRRARDSMTQSMGEVAIEPVLDVLEGETDDYIRSFIMQSILASRAAASSERAVEILGTLLDDPALAWEANYALARIGTERAIDILHQRTVDKRPDEIMDNLEYTGSLALRILSDYVRHADPRVRAQAIEKLLSLEDSLALPLLLELVDDPDEHTRRFAREAVFQMDHVLLEESARNWLLAKTGKVFGRLRPPSREGTDVLFTVLRFFHWFLLGASFLVGFLLLTGGLRAFEPYKLTLVLSFLLVLGIVGDFLFFAEPTLYRFSTAGRLLLVLGLLFLRDDPLPGETRGRVERLVVRSLWVLVPLLLVYGVPLLSEALRHALRDFGFLIWTLLLLSVLLFLVFEQAVVPWDLFPRGGRAERALTLGVSTAVVTLCGVAVWRFLEEPAVAVDDDRFYFGLLLLLPFLGAWAFHVRESGLFRKPAGEALTVSPPPGRLRVVQDGESLLVRLRRKRARRGLPRLVLGALVLAGTFGLADRAASAGAPALVLLAIVPIVAIAFLWVVASGVVGGLAIQIRGPAARAATTFLGGAFGRPAWVRRPRLPVTLEALPLEPHEKQWLSGVMREWKTRDASSLTFALEGEGENVRLEVTNHGRSPSSIADFEAVGGEPLKVGGRNVYLSRSDREAVVAPGVARTFRPRVYAALVMALLSGASPLRAAIVAEHPSEYTWILERGDPALWNEAVVGILGDDGRLPIHAYSSVMRRFDALDEAVRASVVRALRNHPKHPRTVGILLALVREEEGPVRDAAAETLFSLRTAEAMDPFRDLVLEGGPFQLDAMQSLVSSFSVVPPRAFDERYLPALRTLFESGDLSVRRKAIYASMRIDTEGLREEWFRALSDPDPEIRHYSRWQLAELGDPRPCPLLLEWARTVGADPDVVGDVGRTCAPSSLLDYVRGYEAASGAEDRAFYGKLIEGGLIAELPDDPALFASLRNLSATADPALRERVAAFLEAREEWARNRNGGAALRSAAFPLFLLFSAVVAGLAGILLFVWAFRLWALASRVRNRPVSRAASVASGPVALEGEAQPAESYLRHPMTGEPCLYYAGADVEHPDSRFYLEDDSGRVLVDPRRAVLFSEDGILVAGERVHVVGFASGRSPVVIGKDEARRSLHARFVHGLISALFGFGRSTSVTKMLFSDPRNCFWIWDDLERRPMGERRDQLWLALSVLLGGAWILVFAVAVLGLVDREMSEPLAQAIERFTRAGLR